jgi:hypothetical protein
MSETNEKMDKEQVQARQDELVAEMNRLGENLGKLLKAAWDSDERRSVEREIRSGLDQLNKQVDKAAQQAREARERTNTPLRKAANNVKGVWETAHGPQVVNEMRLGLVDSLRKINDELAKAAMPKPAQEVKAEPAPAEPAPAEPAQEVKPE